MTGDRYLQSGNLVIGNMDGGEIQNGAKIAGVIYEAPSNEAEMNPSIVNHINLTISSEKNGCSPQSDLLKQTHR